MLSKSVGPYPDKIITNKSFGNSTPLTILLKYLVRRILEADIPKETTVVNEIFGKRDFDPSQNVLSGARLQFM